MFNWLRRWLKHEEFVFRHNTPQTYRINGVSAFWLNWDARKVSGWYIDGPRVDDFLLAPMASGRTGRFRFTEVEHCSDPSDMYFATVADVDVVEEKP